MDVSIEESRPATNDIQFHTPSSRSSLSNDSFNEDNLPYPVPLARNDFLDPNFNAQTYLSSLHNRHQTLEDLRSELRNRSQELNKELLDLVNVNYQDFLGLGSSLHGGEEKVEEVRVGLLGLKREIEGVKKAVQIRSQEVEEGLQERKQVRRDIAVARGLLEVDERLGELEERLMVDSAGKAKTNGQVADDDSEEDTDEDDEDDEETDASITWTSSIGKLDRHVQLYLGIRQLMASIGPDHPFLMAQQSRMMRLRNTISLDLGAALKQAKYVGEPGKARVMKIVGLYGEMDEAAEAVRVLRSLKK